MIFWGCLVFSRDFGRQQRAKFKIYFNFEGYRASGVALSLWLWSCPLVAGCRVSGVLRCVFRPFLPAFSPFAASAFLQYLRNMPYFAF